MKRIVFSAFIALAAIFTLPAASGEGFDPFLTSRTIASSPAKDMVPQKSAQDPCPPLPIDTPVGLIDVVERALCNNPQTKQAWANVKAQAAQVGISESAYLPTMNAAYSITRGPSGTRIKDLPQLGYDVRPTIRNSSANLTWTLFDFGLRAANLENAQELLAAANATQDATLQNVFVSAAQAYYDMLAAQAALEASRDSERAARESFMAADAKYKAGVGALADKLQAQTTYAQAMSNRVKADGDLKNAKGVLAIAMGFKANALILLKTDNANSPLPDTAFVQSIDVLIEEAERRHPSLIAAKAQLRAAQAHVNAAIAEGLPTVTLTGAFNRSDQLGQYPRDTFTHSNNIGAQITIPLFEGFGRSYRIQSAQAQVESKVADVESTEQQVSLNVWKNYQALQTETVNLKATGELVQSADQSFKVAQGRYKTGVGNILELLNAQSALASAKQQQIRALSNWRSARLNLAASLGQLGFWAID